MKTVKAFIKKCIPENWHAPLRKGIDICFKKYSTKSYSQEGEDLILNYLFAGKDKGFYVDVGAHHPIRFSNTYHFYKKGWSGVNLDAMPGSMKLFSKIRPRDVNLEIPICDTEASIKYYIFNEPAFNSFHKDLSESRDGNDNVKIISSKDLTTRTLESVLDEYLPKHQQIDFLSVDVEGLDLEVLRSNNWEKYSPEILLVEIVGVGLEEKMNSKIYKYLKDKKYIACAQTLNTVFFCKVP